MTDGSRPMEIMRALGMTLGQPMIAVVGCGGAGSNIVNAIYWNCPGVHTVAVNTDSKSLERVNAHRKIRIGAVADEKSCGLPEVGERCAEESSLMLRESIEGYDIVFIVTGLGGGTGSGAAPVVARIAREENAVVFAIPILPFSIEADRRAIAMTALERLQEFSNVTLPLDNEKLLTVGGALTLRTAFGIIDQSVIRIIEKICEHSSSYVAELIDEISSGFMMEEVVVAEHQSVIEEIPRAIHSSLLEPSLEFPIEPEWNDLTFN